MKEFRPMLAETFEDISSLKFPIIASPKFDGIRCLKISGCALSRSLKLIKNKYVRETIERICPDGLDGELMTGNTFQACTSAVMSEDGEPEFTWWVFDYHTQDPYEKRLIALGEIVASIQKHHKENAHVKIVPTKLINNVAELLAYEKECLGKGFEGVMMRDPQGPYKYGRSTVREGWLLKLKRFVDSEAVIIDFDELETNTNTKKVNELGLSQRSSAKVGKVKAGKLGAFIVRDLKSGIQFNIGTGDGLTMDLRQKIWDSREKYLQKIIKYKYQDIGVKVAPRSPVFLGFRDENDL
jgi:DNA ligase 1